jgi:SAM-dependent methyltransferase
MSDWSSGYNIELGYTFDSYKELAPAWLNFTALVCGVQVPQGRWRYLELGCGQGVGLCMLAGQYPEHEFLGIDFNPVHISHARQLAEAASLKNVRFEEADFTQLAKEWPSNWGLFDYVTGHGLLSWLDPHVRQSLIDCIERSTAPGALVQLSYNTQPGWLSTVPIQHLLRLWQTTESLSGIKALDIGVKRFEDMQSAGAVTMHQLPGLAARLDQIRRLDRAYLTQEYLHDNWHPLWSDEVADLMQQAKLNFVGTATLGDLYLPNMIPPAMRDILNKTSDPKVREVTLDVLINQGFRRDVYARGKTPLWAIEQQRQLLNLRVMAVKLPPLDDLKFKNSGGQPSAKPEIYRPIFEALGQGPQTLAELQLAAKISLPDLLQAISLLLHGEHIILFNPTANNKSGVLLNRALAQRAADGAPYKQLLATRLGYVISASAPNMVLLHLTQEKPKATAEWLTQQLIQRLLQTNRGLVHNGANLTTPETMLPRAQQLVQEFLTQVLPSYQKIGVV